MVGLVLVAHAGLARELLSAAEMIVGKMGLAEAVGISPDDTVENIRTNVTEAIKKVSPGGVIIMTDMFGGTPSNMSLSFLKDNVVEVLTGVNLPMLLKFAAERETMPIFRYAGVIMALPSELPIPSVQAVM